MQQDHRHRDPRIGMLIAIVVPGIFWAAVAAGCLHTKENHMTPLYKDVSSSNIVALAYADGKAFVEFGGGRRFAYVMPRATFNELSAAKSIGSYFARNVKGAYPVAWNGQRCTLQSCRNDATLEGVVAGGKFWVCDACAKDGRFAAITFTPYKPQEPKK